VRNYLKAEDLFLQAFNAYDNDVKKQQFPLVSESY